jgi:hypothetical protein
MIKDDGYVDIGLACASVCLVVNRDMSGRQADQLNSSVFEAIERLTT